MEQKGPRAWITNLFLVSLLNVPRILPYKWRIPVIGWVTAHIIAPISGHQKRAIKNLNLICPELSAHDVQKISQGASNNAGRVFGEMYSKDGFFKRLENTTPQGPGAALLEKARLDKKPIIMVSGHFGNYDAFRVVLARAGHQVGGLYRPMTNAYFNSHYAKNLEAIASPSFRQGRAGLAAMIKHLRSGNMIALLTDQRDRDGATLTFFGHPTFTPLSAARMALKYDAYLFPVYGIRQGNGLDFSVIVENPIPHTDPETMMQSVNDSLEARVRDNMDQWLWVHRRWLGATP